MKSQKEEKSSTKEDVKEIVEEKELLPDQSDLIISSEPLTESVKSHKEQQETDIAKEESTKLSSKEKSQDLVKDDESSKKEVKEVVKEDEGFVSVKEVIESSKSHKEQQETDFSKEESTKQLGEELFLTSSIKSNTDVLPSESSIKSQKEEESSSAKQNTVIAEKKEEYPTTSTKEILSSDLPLTSSTKSQTHAEADFSKEESKELVKEGESSKEEVKEALKEDEDVVFDHSVKEAIESVASQKEQRETDFSNEDSKVKEEELLPNTSLESSTSILPSTSSNKSQKEKEKELEEGESKKGVAENKEFSKDILPSENSAKEIPTRPTTTESIQSEFEEQEKDLSKEEERFPTSSVKSTKEDVLPSNSSTKSQRVEEKSFEESKESKLLPSESSTKSKKEKEIEKEKESQPKNDLNCPSLESRPSSALSSKTSLPSSLLQAVNAKSILPLLERKHYKDSPSYQEAKKDIAIEGERLVKNIQLNQTKVQDSMKEVTSLKTSIQQHQQKLDEMTNLCLSFLSDLKSYRTN